MLPWPVGVVELDEGAVESHVEGVVSITLPDSEAQCRQFNELFCWCSFFIRSPSKPRRCGDSNEDDGPLTLLNLSEFIVAVGRLPYLSVSEG